MFVRLDVFILAYTAGFSYGNKLVKTEYLSDSLQRQLHDDEIDLSEATELEVIEAYIHQNEVISGNIVCVNEPNGFDNPRALPYYVGRGDGFNTVAECVSQCLLEGHVISGRADHGMCWCADSEGYTPVVSSNVITFDEYGINSSCNCNNIDTADVGHSLLCVTEITISAEYVGCFKDDEPRALPIFVGDGMSYFKCALECFERHFQFFGRQYDKECWCGTGYTHAIYGTSTDCDCDGSNIGDFSQCVYKIPERLYVDNIIYLGCYADENDDRALPSRLAAGDGSIEECSEACTENFYDLFGVQYDMECWCGRTNVDDPYKHGYSTGCDCDSLTNVGAFKYCLFAIGKPEPTTKPTYMPTISSMPSLSAAPTSLPTKAPV